jgi:AcrR family transcriptional regulator
MAQVLKDEVEQRIRQGALQVFAERGFAGAGMGDIARAAGISQGNVYRYFGSKELLFEAVVPRELPTLLLSLLRRRVRALSGERDVNALPAGAPFHLASEDLLTFALRHRLEVVILLGRNGGSVYEGFDLQVRRMLEKLAVLHFQELEPQLTIERAQLSVLELVYQNLLHATVAILLAHDQEQAIRASVAGYAKYHLAGLKALFS